MADSNLSKDDAAWANQVQATALLESLFLEQLYPEHDQSKLGPSERLAAIDNAFSAFQSLTLRERSLLNMLFDALEAKAIREYDLCVALSQVTDPNALKGFVPEPLIEEAKVLRIYEQEQGVSNHTSKNAGKKNEKARKFVKEEWIKHKESYDHNKSDFARHYSRLVLEKFSIEITDKSIRDRWLLNL